MNMHSLLIVDDNEDVRSQLRWGLSKEGYDLHLAGDGEEAMGVIPETCPRCRDAGPRAAS